MDFEFHRKYLRRHGVLKYLFYVLYRILERTLGFKALRSVVVTLDTMDSAYLEENPTLQADVVRGSDLKLLIDEWIYVTEKFVAQSIERGDWCCLFRDGDNIASYGWYTTQACRVIDDVFIHFSPDHVYMFNGFTAPAYRGQRLHSFGMAHALREAVNEGYKGLVSYIEADNASSINSSLRLGYRVFGTCFLIRVFGRAFTLRTPGCRQYEFYLRTIPPDS